MKKMSLLNIVLLFVTLSMLYSLIATILQALQHPQAQASATWFLAFEIVLGLGLIFLPRIIAKIGKFSLPDVIYLFFLLFIYGSVYLGTVNHFYSIVAHWDKGLHLLSGPLVSAFGLSLLGAMLPKDIIFRLSRSFVYLYGVAFGVLGGVLWEFYEFTCDSFGMNLQRYMQAGKPLVGRAALLDTMGDLWMDFIGAALFMVFVIIKLAKDKHWLKNFEFHKI